MVADKQIPKIPYSIARELHRRVLARMEAEGLKRRRRAKSAFGGYVAAFYGPPIQGKHPVVAVGIKPEEAQLAADLGEFDDLVGARCRNALMVYHDLVEQGPPVIVHGFEPPPEGMADILRRRTQEHDKL